MSKSSYGKRGGTSATAGKRKSIYEGKAPDGSILHVASFHVDTPKAWMHISCQAGTCWYGNAVRPEPLDWGTGANGVKTMWVECEKVK